MKTSGSRLFLRCLSALTCSKPNQLSCRCRSDEVGCTLQLPACLTLASQAAWPSGKWRSPKISSTGTGRAPQGTPNLSLLWPPAGQELEHSFMVTIMRTPSYECWKVRGPVLCLKSQDHSRHRLRRDPLRGCGCHHHLLLPLFLLLPVPPASAPAEPV